MFILTHVSSSEWLSRGSQRSSAHGAIGRFYTRGQTGKPTDKQIIWLAAELYNIYVPIRTSIIALGAWLNNKEMNKLNWNVISRPQDSIYPREKLKRHSPCPVTTGFILILISSTFDMIRIFRTCHSFLGRLRFLTMTPLSSFIRCSSSSHWNINFLILFYA